MKHANHSVLDSIRAIVWSDDELILLDQRRLPADVVWLRFDRCDAVAEAIRGMVVRGAPAIGITAAYGVVLAARNRIRASGEDWRSGFADDLDQLAAARPTAVNLRWAVSRLRALAATLATSEVESALIAEARAVHDEDIAANRRMGELGAALIRGPCGVLTHCNTGSLATGGFGTALGVIRTAYGQGRLSQVYADETRPWLQGARLTAWELVQDSIPVTLLCDSAAAWLMRTGKVNWVIVGADRIAANGDTANKIGTYSLAIAARHHGVRFMVAAPTSTIDPGTPDGGSIALEQRAGEEVTTIGGRLFAPEGTQAWNPVFDVTPAGLIDAIVTERGVVADPSGETIQAILRPQNP